MFEAPTFNPHSSHLQQVSRGLEGKYGQAMYFFKVKEINQILSMESRSSAFMDFCDTRVMVEEIQYLKRVYYYRTQSGKPQIQQRMKLICQHYATNPLLSTFTYQYPMMIVTNTKSLFQRRKKRLRKIQAGEGSSDDTEENQDFGPGLEFPTKIFLDQLDTSSFSQRSSQYSNVSFETVAYNAYDQDTFPKEASSLLNINLKTEEPQLANLIQDYNPNPQKVRNEAFANIENHQYRTVRESAFDIIPIQDRIQLEKEESVERRAGTLTNYVDLLLSRPINFSGLGMTSQNPILQKYSTVISTTEPQSIDKERQERASRRQKIRLKAEQLLKRVRIGQTVKEQ